MKRLFPASVALSLIACATQPEVTIVEDEASDPLLEITPEEARAAAIAALVAELPEDYTGCDTDVRVCFVGGDEVDVALRYEPQSGRFWFLNPQSGDTHYADGTIRTNTGLKLQLAALSEIGVLPMPVEVKSEEADDNADASEPETSDDAAEEPAPAEGTVANLEAPGEPGDDTAALSAQARGADSETQP